MHWVHQSGRCLFKSSFPYLFLVTFFSIWRFFLSMGFLSFLNLQLFVHFLIWSSRLKYIKSKSTKNIWQAFLTSIFYWSINFHTFLLPKLTILYGTRTMYVNTFTKPRSIAHQFNDKNAILNKFIHTWKTIPSTLLVIYYGWVCKRLAMEKSLWSIF